jgi:hypothetical protein
VRGIRGTTRDCGEVEGVGGRGGARRPRVPFTSGWRGGPDVSSLYRRRDGGRRRGLGGWRCRGGGRAAAREDPSYGSPVGTRPGGAEGLMQGRSAGPGDESPRCRIDGKGGARAPISPPGDRRNRPSVASRERTDQLAAVGVGPGSGQRASVGARSCRAGERVATHSTQVVVPTIRPLAHERTSGPSLVSAASRSHTPGTGRS